MTETVELIKLRAALAKIERLGNAAIEGPERLRNSYTIQMRDEARRALLPS